MADGGYAVLTLLHRLASLKNPVVAITRLRLDAAPYQVAPPRAEKQNGRPRKKGQRLATLTSVLEDKTTVWTRIVVERFYSQCRREVEIVSACCVWYHSGMPPVEIRYVLIRDPEGKFAPQALSKSFPGSFYVGNWKPPSRKFVCIWEWRPNISGAILPYCDLAIYRTTPALLEIFSLVILLAQDQWVLGKLSIRQSAWYVKEVATFSDALACVRRDLWRQLSFWISSQESDIEKLQATLLSRFSDVLCYPA